MKNKQKMSLLTLGVCVTLAATSYASGAPTSQFGFTGWPYRQQTGCGNQTSKPSCTASPAATPTPAVKPDSGLNCPSQPTAGCPTKAPQPTEAPEATPVPEPTTTAPTEAPIETAEPTKAPAATATQAPTPTPVKTPTPAPTAAPTATKAPEKTQKPVETTPAPSTDDDYTTGSVTAQEENAFLLLNADRAANGRSALTLDPALCALARMKSNDMYQNNYFAHTSPTLGSAAEMLRNNGYAFSAVGENIAHHATVEKAQAAFMSSDGHRRNILGTSWTKVGIGVCYDSQGFVYVTQLFVR